ncbi:MAG: molecular chaperone DnaK [Bdellovibrionota bacterium]
MNKVLGIDLGTSNSCVSIVVKKKAIVIPDKAGTLIHPSIVHFRQDGSVTVGKEAKKWTVQDSAHTVYSSKRLIGRKYFSQEVKKAKVLMPYQIVEGPNQSVEISIDNKQYSLQEISAMILRKMKSIAENYLGEEITKAVVTVPAYFNDNQRAATIDAGQIAGLDVLRIINEPTAAALSYGYGKTGQQKVVVYDLGGGTFDVSVLELGNGVFEVISTAGDTFLGGDDFDDRIIDWVTSEFRKKYDYDLFEDKKTLQSLREKAEVARINLNTKDNSTIVLDPISAGDKTVDFSIDLTRKIFYELVGDLMQRTLQVCDEAIQKARLSLKDIEGVILVGGPTRMPIVKEFVKTYFQKEPKSDIDPDQVVAMGAAIQGSALIGETSDVVLVDLTPLSLGIEISGGLVQRIIDINTPLPVDHTKTFTTVVDDQQSVKIRVFQGEAQKASENELLGEFTLDGLPRGAAGSVSVEVTFEIDTNGVLNVTAKNPETGKQQTVRLVAAGRLEKDRIKQLSSPEANI